MKSIFIYGTGSGAEKYYESNKGDFEVLGFIDSNLEKEGQIFKGQKIFSPSAAVKERFDFIVLANEYVETYNVIVDLGVPPQKIKVIYYRCMFGILRNVVSDYYKMYEHAEHNVHPVCTMKMSYQMRNHFEDEYEEENDYARYKLLELIAEEIYNNNVTGNVAEVGVFTGAFSKIINRVFPDRKLYLFDTFEGFPEGDKAHDIENSFSKEAFFNVCGDFRSTAVSTVLNKMAHKDNCIVRKGYFPDTIDGLEDQFAFASIDVDLYRPMFHALEYFYPRLAKGGYLLLHDYNHTKFQGVKQAVADFEKKETVLHKVPVADQGGSVVIIK